jgi:predicted kinase
MGAIEAALRGDPVDLQHATEPDLVALRGCPQTPAFHAEGDVAEHSRRVYELACEHADRLSGSTDHQQPAGSGPQTALRLAALLHDLGKPATTRQKSPGHWSAHGHDLEGARLVSGLFAGHPALQHLPLGVYASVHALVRAHMWSYAGERIAAGDALRLSQVADPRLLMALWDSDTRGRICDDAAELADRIAFAGLVLEELDAARPDSYGRLDQVATRGSVGPRAWRETFRALVEGGLGDVGAVGAHLARAERHTTGSSLTYTIGLPGVGKSTWAREVWAPATGGTVLSGAGGRRRDRRAAASAVLRQIPAQLAAGRAICVDATHLTRETRDVITTYAGRYGAELHAVYFQAPVQLALRRQSTRPAAEAVPAATILSMARKLRWPTPDEYQTLSIIPSDAGPWAYTAESRWLTDPAARAAYPVRAPWSG